MEATWKPVIQVAGTTFQKGSGQELIVLVSQTVFILLLLGEDRKQVCMYMSQSGDDWALGGDIAKFQGSL